MRRSRIILTLTILLLLIYTLHSVSTLLLLLFETASTDIIHPSSLPPPNTTTTTPLLIPKIIHQTYINTSIPTPWLPAQQSCLALHPDYTYHFWTDASSLAFIASTYPWFLPTYTSYPHAIQRADAIRYFALAHFGGVYLDLDNGCKRRLDPLLAYPAWVHLTAPTGISNDAMGAAAGHPFFVYVIEQLQPMDRNWVLPYVTVMASTGPLFLSVVWEKWRRRNGGKEEEWEGRVRVLRKDEYESMPWAFFERYEGSSWHGGDARFFGWVGRHWLVTILVGLGVVLMLCACVWWGMGKLGFKESRRRSRFPGLSESHSTQESRFRRRLWKRQDERTAYELVEE